MTAPRLWPRDSMISCSAGPLAPADVRTAPPVSAPPLAVPKLLEYAEHLDGEHVTFAWVGPPEASRDAAALEFAERVWTNDYSPHHLHGVVTDKSSQYSGIDRIALQDASFFAPDVKMVPGASATAIEEKITAEFARMAREGPTSAEMAGIRNHFEAGRLSGLESVSTLASTIQQVHQF